MAIDFRIHVSGFQALREKQIEMFGWPSTIDVGNKILAKYLTQMINPKFVKEGSSFNPIAHAYVYECNAQTGGHMKVAQFDPAGRVFEDYVDEQIDLNTDEILLKSLLTLHMHQEISVPSMDDIDTLTQLKGKKITAADQVGLAKGMAILRDPKLPSGSLDPTADMEFPKLASLGEAGMVGKSFGKACLEAVS